MDNSMDTGEEQLDFKPPKDDKEEVTEVAKEVKAPEVRVDNCILWFLKLPHIEAKEGVDL